MDYSHELVLPNEDLPFKLFVFEGGEGNYIRQKHWHRSIEIFALFEGSLIFYLNDVKYELKPGQFMLVNSNEVHSICAKNENKTVVLQIPHKLFEKYYSEDGVVYFDHAGYNSDEIMMGMIREMYLDYLNRDYGYDFKVLAQFYKLMHHLIVHYKKYDVDAEWVRRYKKLNRLTNITDYMKKNYKEDLSLESLADIFGYSKTYLSRMFKVYANTNYKSMLDDIRLEHAYNDLSETKLSVNEIALQNGFANSKAFARIFKNKYGMLPGEFRNRKR